MQVIDADKWIQQLIVLWEYAEEKGIVTDKQFFDKEILPLTVEATIEAEPVKHGRWENYPSHVYRRCSLCKVEFDKPKFRVRANYCPNCGARMDL